MKALVGAFNQEHRRLCDCENFADGLFAALSTQPHRWRGEEAAHSNTGEQAENFINFYLLSVSENAKNNKMPLIQL